MAFDETSTGDGAPDPEALKQCLTEAIGSAQRLGANEIAGTLMGVLFMHAGAPAASLAHLRAIRDRYAESAGRLHERVERAVMLMEQAQSKSRGAA